MKTKVDDGGPAFPTFDVVAGERDGHGDIIDAYTTSNGGMSLRDYFAGQALAGMLANPSLGSAYGRTPTYPKEAYAFADAMMAARKCAATGDTTP